METVRTTVLGYPRIGARRELKRATEDYWAGRIDAAALDQAAAALRRDTWETLRVAGVDLVPSHTFSLYDHVLDHAELFGAVPRRFAGLQGLDRYFAMARGAEGVPPLEMTKWFDTNYHYLVPELGPDTTFRTAGARSRPVAEYHEAAALGVTTRPVLLGPLSFLLLAKPAADAPKDFRPLDLLEPLLDAYVGLLDALADAGVEWVQLDEPVLAADRNAAELSALRTAYERLGSTAHRPKLLVATYFGPIGPALPVLARTRVDGLALDLVAGAADADRIAAAGLGDRTLVAGLVDGRNIWRTDLSRAMSVAASLLGSVGDLVVGTSSSLLHVPLDLTLEDDLPDRLRDRLAFARQKVDEVVLLGRALREGHHGVERELAESSAAIATATDTVDGRVRARLASLGTGTDRRDYAERARLQAETGGLPPLPTTTIGSFPQTARIRRARADLRAGRIDQATYDTRMRAEIDEIIALQEDIGLDVLVHGEPERNDMVQYFAERLSGYASTSHGWVQSYGTRYVRPPILHADVSRPEPMTVEWTKYAQSRTDKPVKGMLTGPVTMLAWSFVRDDQPQAETARQVALALRDEIRDLEAAGIRYIQVDEPALRELLPLRAADQPAYVDWAVGAFRLATSGVCERTQIHSHMCYSEFGEIVDTIDALDADVTSVEAARSRMELVTDLAKAGYRRGIGPGVYDIHSPRIPTVAEIEEALRLALEAVPPDRLWVNPDCGLKTRTYAEVEPALRHLVEATRRVRATLPT
ncbi:5-methyltetrahydropteroyltriglutamate--homocysteine methyltransferase [Actinopolymorpha cephalotaxi]|uniref:5-methyltetrahydropteroyltriglutamate--homocysteine methyltransferase n=1 Tax=Actinopolymorpha cephalotaxi TaxID=504797 RepID=A0A1I2KW62_9ACTN|nr:5-methyltetrahydropteroyltriglutamate--homocysteine S-methyltransferase [Actinopolymorpha cephalotaxi]NYH84597.1 5-methyltetrahydropteroyltriglutamate--homocysteine methyltransferase [Actinopolymorpha cephalotaxi]SFF69146.1 5-methyltetrahydropteroyltriglutamate--homocysteine methyltransferase [Actinopolymorpha cephalotaxi]